MKYRVHFETKAQGHRTIAEGPVTSLPLGRIPRLSKLMALAIHCQHLIETGLVRDQADLARLAGITRARATQILALNHLAPDLIEAILHLPRIPSGRDRLVLRDLMPLCQEPLWAKQREMWARL